MILGYVFIYRDNSIKRVNLKEKNLQKFINQTMIYFEEVKVKFIIKKKDAART